MKKYLLTEKEIEDLAVLGQLCDDQYIPLPDDAVMLTREQLDAALRKHIGGERRQLLTQALMDEFFGKTEAGE